MGKHAKLPAVPKARTSAAQRASAPTLDADALLRSWIARLERIIAPAEALIASGEAAPTVLREVSGVARALVSLSAELRQREKAAAVKYDALTEELVLGFIRNSATDRERLNIQREVGLLIDRGKRSGLA